MKINVSDKAIDFLGTKGIQDIQLHLIRCNT